MGKDWDPGKQARVAREARRFSRFRRATHLNSENPDRQLNGAGWTCRNRLAPQSKSIHPPRHQEKRQLKPARACWGRPAREKFYSRFGRAAKSLQSWSDWGELPFDDSLLPDQDSIPDLKKQRHDRGEKRS